ncbi:hypothetical protein ACWZEH_33610 [Streptomyces sp. QTS137]
MSWSRDEGTACAIRVRAVGDQAELHVRAGSLHGSDALYTQARISATARRTRTDWFARPLSTEGCDDGSERAKTS